MVAIVRSPILTEIAASIEISSQEYWRSEMIIDATINVIRNLPYVHRSKCTVINRSLRAP